jgi:hypothetical protein
MSTQNDQNGGGNAQKGYRPLNEGYVPNQRGYVPNGIPSSLPKPPKGGTGQSQPTGSGSNPNGGEKPKSS